jgi:uncharacterized phage-associated protein
MAAHYGTAIIPAHLGTSRRSLFDEIECPAFRALPVEPYLYAEWNQCESASIITSKSSGIITRRRRGARNAE